jgi:hypothetical protein
MDGNYGLKQSETVIVAFTLISVLLIFLVGGVCWTKISRASEKFTAPGLTLTKPPSWFPQNSAKPYREKDWKTKMYLDRYPFRVNNAGENCQTDINTIKNKLDTKFASQVPDSDYISSRDADKLASAYRLWRM